MKSRTYLHAARGAWFSCLVLRSSFPAPATASGVASKTLTCWAKPAALLLLMGMGSGIAFAQQPAQGWPQSDPYGPSAPQQPAPYGYGQPQQGYSQPGYAQTQPYPQQNYPPQPYAQQPYAQPSYPNYSQTEPQQSYPQAQPPAQPLDAEQLEQLVAPIALYPDTLVAQILAAATYPAQVVGADHWRQTMAYASPDEIAAQADMQPWDPSVKALTAFPQVLELMDHNLQWTTDLGNAYYNQPQDVLETVQVLRQRAEQAGTLQSTPQEAVSYDQGYVELAPANPQVVYVPAYNPWDVYGEPVTPYHGFSLLGSLASFAGSSPVRYGLGIAMSAFSHTGFGWMGWALNWLSQSVLFHGSNYYSHSTTVAHWNLPRGGGIRIADGGRVGRMPESYGRPGNGYYGGAGQGYARPPERFAENRPQEFSGHGYPAFGDNRVRPALDGYRPVQPATRPQPYVARPQEAFSRMPEPARQGSFGSGFVNRPGGAYGYAGRPNSGYGSPVQPYRPPAAAPQRGFDQHFAEPSMGREFAGSREKQERSGGFHPFGGSHEPKPYRAESHLPKNFNSAPKFKGGHSGGGGHGGLHLFGGHHR